jgi:hypothetical protein
MARRMASGSDCHAANDRLLRLPGVGDNAAMQTEPPKAEPTKRKRRRFQFRLRTLMIVVTPMAGLCGTVTWVRLLLQSNNKSLGWFPFGGE